MLLSGGEEISIGQYLLQVCNTPGHTPGHISLYEPQKKFLICGDAILPTIMTNAAIHIQQTHHPIRQYLESLRTLKAMDIDLILPGHGDTFSGHRKRIDEILEHYRQKKDAVWRPFQENDQPLTAYDISRRLSFVIGTRTIPWDQLDGLNKRFALLQTIALLEELTDSQNLRQFHRDAKVYYVKL